MISRVVQRVFPAFVLVVCLVSNLGCTQKEEQEPRSYLVTPTPGAIFTPAPWSEDARVTSPNKKIDAVLVSRVGLPLGDSTYDREVNQKSLYLVPSGVTVKDDPPYPGSELLNFMNRTRRETALTGFGLADIALQWQDDSSLSVSARSGSESSVFSQDDSKWISVGGQEHFVLIDFKIDRAWK